VIEREASGELIEVRYWPALIFAIAFVISVGVYVSDTERSVAYVYENAANEWMASNSLYIDSMKSGHGFLYLPHAAILHTPYALINQWLGSSIVGEVLWRFVSWCVFAYGTWRLVRIVCRNEDLVQWRVAFAVSVLGVSCIRIGQSTLMMGGVMMLTIEAWQLRRFNLATCLMTLAIAFKPLALVLAMLLFALSRPMRIRLVIGAVVLAVLPFATQSSGYVASQYVECTRMLATAAELGDNREWAQLFGMLKVFGISFPPTTVRLTRVVAALATLGVMIVVRCKLPRERQAVWLLATTMVYLMLFNPRTENSTYCLVGPVFGIFMAQLWAGEPTLQWGGRPLSFLLLVVSTMTAGSYEIGKYFTPTGSLSIWVAPLCCCFLLAVLCFQIMIELRYFGKTKDK